MGMAPAPKIYIQNRQGKKVTVISGLHTYGTARLEKIAKKLKAKLGCGGTVKNGVVEIQGDKALDIQKWFEAKNKG